ncbi:hypothetical protein BT69DRAFT_1280436, partial [Atractiella rhizophila]
MGFGPYLCGGYLLTEVQVVQLLKFCGVYSAVAGRGSWLYPAEFNSWARRNNLSHLVIYLFPHPDKTKTRPEDIVFLLITRSIPASRSDWPLKGPGFSETDSEKNKVRNGLLKDAGLADVPFETLLL